MEFNADKFQLIQHGQCEERKLPYNLPNNQELKKSKTVKVLGTQVSEDFTGRENINILSNNATSFANWILRMIKSRESGVMLHMYRS